jgi:hypothetical protein
MVAFDEGATVRMLAASFSVLFITRRRAIDCAVAPILSFCAEIERKNGNKPGIKTVALESYQREHKRLSGRG